MGRSPSNQTSSTSSSSQPRNSAWQFLVFSNPHAAKTNENRQRVRSHATRHYHRRTRDSMAQGIRRLREDEFELDVSPLLQRPIENAVHSLYAETDDAEERWPNTEISSPEPFADLGSGRSDPFFQYPIRMGCRENELYDHRKCYCFFWNVSEFNLVFDQTCVMFQIMQNIGFVNLVRQTAAFCQLLAMSSWHLIHLNHSGSPKEHLRLSLSATQDLQKQINDPLQCGSDNTIGAVLVFACCAVSDSC